MDESLKTKFKNMIEYQKKDIELRKLNSLLERDQALVNMNKHKKAFNEAKQTLSNCEQQATAIIDSYGELVHYVDENEALLESLENAEALTDEELDARIKKLDSLKSKFINAEKKARDMDEKSNGIMRARSEAIKSGNAAKQMFTEAKGKHGELVNSKADEVAKLNADLDKLRGVLDTEMYNEYQKLVEEKKFPPIVPATGDDKKGLFNCGGCGLNLSQQGNALLKDKGWCRCENCRRLIYKPD